MSKRNPELLIKDILDSCNKILDYTSSMNFDVFLKDAKTIDAVIRNFEIIAEAANRLPDEFKEQHPSIDWHKIRGFRNRIVLDYMGIDLGIVWDIRNNYLPSLIESLKKI